MGAEWDFVAADVVVHEAGGVSPMRGGARFTYNKQIPRNIGGVLLSVDPTTHQRILDTVRPELPIN